MNPFLRRRNWKYILEQTDVINNIFDIMVQFKPFTIISKNIDAPSIKLHFIHNRKVNLHYMDNSRSWTSYKSLKWRAYSFNKLNKRYDMISTIVEMDNIENNTKLNIYIELYLCPTLKKDRHITCNIIIKEKYPFCYSGMEIDRYNPSTDRMESTDSVQYYTRYKHKYNCKLIIDEDEYPLGVGH